MPQQWSAVIAPGHIALFVDDMLNIVIPFAEKTCNFSAIRVDHTIGPVAFHLKYTFYPVQGRWLAQQPNFVLVLHEGKVWVALNGDPCCETDMSLERLSPDNTMPLVVDVHLTDKRSVS